MKVGIIGGGITGLSTALALHKLGIQTVVFEQAKALNEIGAGIWLQPNAIKVLDWLGIKEQVANQGMEVRKMEITNSQLEPFKKIQREAIEDAEGNRIIAIHRARLQKVLFDEAQKSSEIHLNKKYVGHTSHSTGVEVAFEDGKEEVDLLLGADGINSEVRRSVVANSTLRNSDQICWRGISNMNLPKSLANLGREAWGNRIRFGFSQISSHEVYWFAVATKDHFQNAQLMSKKEYLLEQFKDFAPIVSQIIQHTDGGQIHEAYIHDLKKLPTWYKERVCLLGDAAHATSPNMGQGACQGIEDAYYISKCLSQTLDYPEAAFASFQTKRRKKVDYIVNTSWQFGKMAHSNVGQQFMKIIFKLTPEKVLFDQMDKLYSIEK